MFDLFSRHRYGPIGLDIGTEGVKMLQLGGVRGKPFVASAGRWRFPESGSGGPEVDFQTNLHMVAEGVREMLKSGAFHGRDVVSCLRADEISVKNVRMPHMPDHELSSAVVWECQERFGFEVTPDRLYYIRAGEVRQGSDRGQKRDTSDKGSGSGATVRPDGSTEQSVRNEIILMAVPAETVGRHLDMLSESRLNPLHIDAEPLALFRAYCRFLRRSKDTSAVTVIVDIGLSATKVVVARGRTILLIKTIDLAGRKFNESVARELNMTYAEAASLRRRTFEVGSGKERDSERTGADKSSPGRQVEWSVFDALREQVEALAREISLCLRYCSVTFRGLRPDTITLTGGESYDPRLVNSLNEYLDCKCVVGRPLRGIDLGGVYLGGDRRSELTEWSVAMGLALRGFSGSGWSGMSTGGNRRRAERSDIAEVPAGAGIQAGREDYVD